MDKEGIQEKRTACANSIKQHLCTCNCGSSSLQCMWEGRKVGVRMRGVRR